MFLNNLDPGLKIAGVTDLGMIETFKGNTSFVMPEIFYQASTPLRHSRNFLSGIQMLLKHLWTPA
jgi:hypothetical protein